jgi:DNA processing protein
MSGIGDGTGSPPSEPTAASRADPGARDETPAGACPSCLRRAWLLRTCGVRLDFRSRDLTRFWDLLALPDRQLIDAIGGRRRAELHAAYDEFNPGHVEGVGSGPAARPEGVRHEREQTICRHHPAYPHRMRNSPLAPHMLCVAGGLPRLAGMLGETVVAIAGARRATDYGMASARALARGLAAAGVTIASGLSEGIPLAAHSGALEAGGATLTLTAGGLDRCSPVHARALYRRLVEDGCALSELPLGTPARAWSALARARTLALLAGLVIVVEADTNPWELAFAHLAQRLEVPVGAVPGRVSSPASRGCHELIVHGATLIRDPQDALDLLYGVGARQAGDPALPPERDLSGPLAATLECIGAGHDTLERLTATGRPRDELLTSLFELELRGLVVRGDGGRYVPCGGV